MKEYERLMKEYTIGQEVIVYDLGNYMTGGEIKLPIKGTLKDITEYPCLIIETEFGEFEIYENQIIDDECWKY